MLDWNNQPSPYKFYFSSEGILLPKNTPFPGTSLWDLAGDTQQKTGDSEFNMELLSRTLALSYSFTAKSSQQGQTFYYRNAASAGALYPAEIYIAAYNLPGLDPGLYHYNIGNFSLETLRKEEILGYDQAVYPESETEKPAATFFISGIFFRTTWKYRNRGYRYVLLDAGHLLENLLLALKSADISFSLHYDFDDDTINRFMDLDTDREACLICVNIYGKGNHGTSDDYGSLEGLGSIPPADADADNETVIESFYDEIKEIHEVGSRQSIDRDRDGFSLDVTKMKPEGWTDVNGMGAGESDKDKEEDDYTRSVLNRRSRRNFINKAIGENAFRKLLTLLMLTKNRRFKGIDYMSDLNTGFVSYNTDAYTPGFYLLDPRSKRAGLAARNLPAKKMTEACLDQQWLEYAGVHFVFTANLEGIDKTRGPRGYRYAMINAGRLGQIIYLGATALGLGCCGIGAIYDSEAREILGLNSKSSLLYLVAAGHVKKTG